MTVWAGTAKVGGAKAGVGEVKLSKFAANCETVREFAGKITGSSLKVGSRTAPGRPVVGIVLAEVAVGSVSRGSGPGTGVSGDKYCPGVTVWPGLATISGAKADGAKVKLSRPPRSAALPELPGKKFGPRSLATRLVVAIVLAEVAVESI